MVEDVPSSRIARWAPRGGSLDVDVALSAGVPNPSRGAVDFSYTLTTAGEASVAVFDASGRSVATLDSGPRDAGQHPVHWDGRGEGGRHLPPGLYFVRLRLPRGKEAARKVVLLP
jgi:flagellar hook assembly protein FlgD